jgi:nuclease HARBI1
MTNCAGFLDATIRKICRPKYLQNLCYNGYKHIHALKWQNLVCPDGIIAHQYGPAEGRRSDPWLLSAAGDFLILFHLNYEKR